MRLRILHPILAFLLLTPSALAQTGDWQSVMNLRPGTRISVKAGHFFMPSLCVLQTVTDEKLVCERALHNPHPFLNPPSVQLCTYTRKTVREVRLEHSDESNSAVGTVVGAGLGAAIGASFSPERTGYAREGGALLLGAIGGVVGGVFGRDFPIAHGRVIYKR
jgi:hypothetical protein